MAITHSVISTRECVSVSLLAWLVTTVSNVILVAMAMLTTSVLVNYASPLLYWDLHVHTYTYDIAEMQVNYIYTYSVEMDREQEGFFVVTPPEVNYHFNSICVCWVWSSYIRSYSRISSALQLLQIQMCVRQTWHPRVVRSNNDPQYASQEFAYFSQSYGFLHKTSSPVFPQNIQEHIN